MGTIAYRGFAATFKQSRLGNHWRQQDLAKKLHIKQRTVVSWETGTRVPSAGMAFLLCMLMARERTKTKELLAHDLVVSHLIDDLRNQIRTHNSPEFRDLADSAVQRLLQIVEEPHSVEQEKKIEPCNTDPETPSEEQCWPNPCLAPADPLRPTNETSPQMITHLFALFEHLQRHPELITVAYDFLRELAPE